MRIWLDDVRPTPNGFDFWAKNYYEMMGLLISGNVTHISFDHDLGLYGKETELDPRNTGYEVAKSIELQVFAHYNGEQSFYLPRLTWDIHSANPVGRKNIEQAMKSAERFWNK